MAKIQGVQISTAIPEEKIIHNIVDARRYSLSRISSLPDWREGRAIAIVGGGPSLSNHIVELSKEQTVLACGSVHDYLASRNITPDYCLVCDPDPIMARYLKSFNYYTKYLVASQCDKKVFDTLPKRNLYIWDCVGPEDFNKKIFKESNDAIPGGCTVGTRAILCAVGMGFKKIKLYGFDSCLDEKDNHHAYKFVDENLETIGPITELRLDYPSDKVFKVAGYMMAQIFDFQKILEAYANNLEIEVIGEGVLAEIMRLGHLKAKEQLEIKNGD